ncbi:MAG: 4-hydroxy-tetrahydrodipicolinate reductase [Clostridia bacterium]|nr:4-hydroxy-tetrahydrodipicolinate reductase [Clostridia bacterium]
MKIILNGYNGYMGQEIARLLREGYRDIQIVCGVDNNLHGDEPIPVFSALTSIPASYEADCIIDFSHHVGTRPLLAYGEARNLPIILATTGQTKQELAAIRSAAKRIPVFFSANMALGVALLLDLAQTVAAAMPHADIEIIEKHHNHKTDAPSGTALMLADAICAVRKNAYIRNGREGHGRRGRGEIGIHAVRMGNIVGEHEVIVSGMNQTITLKHEAHDRSLFAEGALTAAKFLYRQAPGLYDMKCLLKAQRQKKRAGGGV